MHLHQGALSDTTCILWELAGMPSDQDLCD
jgi:hypothetical protein